MSQPPNSSGDARIALGLLRHSPAWQWPGTALYFLGVVARKLLGVRLLQQRVLHFGDLRCHAHVDGGCGLVFLYEIWVKKTYDAVMGSQSPGEQLLFDVGANCGFFALRQCLQNPTLQAYCFEPHPRTFRVLQRNIELNHLVSRITAVPCAVGAQSGKCQIEVSNSSSMAVVAQRTSEPNDQAAMLDVPLVSLDEFCRERYVWPQVLKIDVEGFEVEVLSGASECLARATRLVVEFHNEDLRARCVKILSQRFEIRTFGTLLFAIAR
jgi:FkbM family methyltransferase